jgi:hypothetical protein
MGEGKLYTEKQLINYPHPNLLPLEKGLFFNLMALVLTPNNINHSPYPMWREKLIKDV